MTVGLIVNPTAGRGAGRNNHQVILDAFAKLGVEVLDLTSRSKDEAEAARLAEAERVAELERQLAEMQAVLVKPKTKRKPSAKAKTKPGTD
mgnify:CR=1 FL=1